MFYLLYVHKGPSIAPYSVAISGSILPSAKLERETGFGALRFATGRPLAPEILLLVVFQIGALFEPLTNRKGLSNAPYSVAFSRSILPSAKLERETGFEPATFSLATRSSTTELLPQNFVKQNFILRRR
jgi:hypothetical protein